MLDKDVEFRHAVAGLIGYKEILDRITSLEERVVKLEERMSENQARNEERFLRVWEEIRNLRKDMQEGFRRLDIKLDSLGARWGIMSERSVREALRGIVGRELGYTIQEWNTQDEEGYVYGYASNVQLDIVVSDSKISSRGSSITC
ncbi:MAG: DUF3782 domain-containing protein [Candidatus Nitrosocaldus sp.]|nr:DUF3782 domain-containing protein [Candidatus Nitrosocaldus sp.]